MQAAAALWVRLPELAAWMGLVLALALHGLAASGHFPAAHRSAELRQGSGLIVLRASLALAIAAGCSGAWCAARLLPWPALVLGGGVALLAAPLVLQLLPDRIVDGRGGLAGFAAAAVLATVALWWRVD